MVAKSWGQGRDGAQICCGHNISDLCGEGTALNPDMVVLIYVIKKNKAHVDSHACTIKTGKAEQDLSLSISWLSHCKDGDHHWAKPQGKETWGFSLLRLTVTWESRITSR